MASVQEDDLLKEVALRNASSILRARQRIEQELEQARDALERKTQELALSLSMMKATLDSATDGILVTDREYRITGYNEKFVQMWHVPGEALQARDHLRLLGVVAAWFDDPDVFRRRVEQIYRDAPPTTFDLLTPRDGRVIERQSRPQVVEGRVVGRVWSYRDISEQRKAEEALREESHVLELLNRTGRNLASKLDLRSVVQSVTDAGTQITGAKFGAFFYNVIDAKGESLLLYTLSGAPREAFEKMGQPRPTGIFGPTFRGAPPIRSDDIMKDPRYGQMGPHHGMPPGHLPVRSYLALAVTARSGEVIGGLFFGHPDPGVFSERSERIMVGIAAQAAVAIDNARLYEAAQRAAEERKLLLESERAARNLAERMSALKDDFLATLSHELRTPLSAIMGWVHILRRSTRPEDLQKGLETIDRNSRLQIQLIEDLLDMNRIASGKVRLDVQPVEPILFIEAALESVRPAADAKGIRLEWQVPVSTASIPGDPARLQQVMGNLLSNAVKFTPVGGRVEVSLAQEPQCVNITVRDSGIGIDPEFVEHVFERFRQADSSKTRRYGGLGLGLSIVKNLVGMHDGTVSASSPGVGLGSSFTVRLPTGGRPIAGAVGEPQQRAAPVAAGPVTADLRGLKVLLVDDDPDGRELARRVLSECEAEVVTAAGAAQALPLVESLRPDVLVSDIGMPDVDGFTLLRQIRALGAARGGNVPAVALTAFGRAEDRAHALAAGFAAHLTKPVEPAQLLATVAATAGRSH